MFSTAPGNRCGHNPQLTRSFEPPERHKARPDILRKLDEKIRAYYDTPAKILPSLNLANGKDVTKKAKEKLKQAGVVTDARGEK